MDATHEYWVEQGTGAIWAVELVDDSVAGCHGPLTPPEVDDEIVDALEYSPVGTTWIEANRSRFVPYPTEVPFIPPT